MRVLGDSPERPILGNDPQVTKNTGNFLGAARLLTGTFFTGATVATLPLAEITGVEPVRAKGGNAGLSHFALITRVGRNWLAGGARTTQM